MKYLHIGIVGDVSTNCEDIAKQIYNINSNKDIDNEHNYLIKYISNETALHMSYPIGQYTATDIASSIIQPCVENKDIIMFVYNSNEISTFYNIKYWLHKANKWSNNCIKILVVNCNGKTRMVPESEGQYMAQIMKFDKYFEISPCDKNSIFELYDYIKNLVL